MGGKNDGWNSRQKHHRKQYFVYKWNIEDNPMAIGNKQDNPIIWSAKHALHSSTLLFDIQTMRRLGSTCFKYKGPVSLDNYPWVYDLIIGTT